ncbi:NUDIX hydrolase domain-like protein [Hypoxylon rubiginosum]|uniref:NUDIX hydrolase domain-like protein n=1 Tax=Hypoxylon rubiginosum TaxID=110542 RepID=A0ACC0CPN3_9PEZI|nr:NUDIX hydrolase domain-like protein [Hypoxylon rubiginosum]
MSITCKQGHRHYGPRGSAGITIFRYRDTGEIEVFLGLRVSYSGRSSWSNFGGVIESGETTEQAALREVHEEIGLSASDLQLTGITEDDHGGWKYTTYYATTTRTITDADIKLDESEHSETAWFTRQELWHGSNRLKGRPLLEGFSNSAVPNLGFLLPPDIDPRTGLMSETQPSPKTQPSPPGVTGKGTSGKGTTGKIPKSAPEKKDSPGKDTTGTGAPVKGTPGTSITGKGTTRKGTISTGYSIFPGAGTIKSIFPDVGFLGTPETGTPGKIPKSAPEKTDFPSKDTTGITTKKGTPSTPMTDTSVTGSTGTGTTGTGTTKSLFPGVAFPGTPGTGTSGKVPKSTPPKTDFPRKDTPTKFPKTAPTDASTPTKKVRWG